MARAQLKRFLFVCAALGTGALWGPCEAGVFRYCDPPSELDATQQDTILRFGAVIKSTLERSGGSLALVARSGLDLSRFQMRYSHAGISLRANPNGPWSVRQLYYDCDERRPRIFDQGIAGFVVGAGDPSIGYFSVVLLPGAETEVERIVQDNRQVLRLLGGTYSANAYPFALRYQNCNQWVAELMAAAWGGLQGPENLRERAQAWLGRAAYRPSPMTVRPRALVFAAPFVPWVQVDDHPEEARRAAVFEVSMPAALEEFVRARDPAVTRVELCHVGRRIVLRRGWAPLPEGCVPEDGDEVVELD
jgi:hypothetical protein